MCLRGNHICLVSPIKSKRGTTCYSPRTVWVIRIAFGSQRPAPLVDGFYRKLTGPKPVVAVFLEDRPIFSFPWHSANRTADTWEEVCILGSASSVACWDVRRVGASNGWMHRYHGPCPMISSFFFVRFCDPRCFVLTRTNTFLLGS